MKNRTLRFTYDPVADAAHIYLKHPIEAGDEVRGEVADLDTPLTSVIYSFDGADRIIGIEILGASKLLPHNLL